ncbi:hypothetical protein PybrP1_002687 [[Pythium] brassicae (nom. inval.)]|nr:hypothetical protein PybrP1_002687 [[Pythium] brassicae (nom. inval.)]
MRCQSCSIRARSANDQSLLYRSGLRHVVIGTLSTEYHLLGDASARRGRICSSPSSKTTLNTPHKRHHNHYHSRTRIVVERAFGLPKNRWRVFHRALGQKTEINLCAIVISCDVLRSMVIEGGDTVNIEGDDPLLGKRQRQTDRLMQVSLQKAIPKDSRSEMLSKSLCVAFVD